MAIIESLEQRRSVYALNKELPVPEERVVADVKRIVELVPDAFNMRSQRVVVALGEKQDQLWDAVFDAFGGKVAREKIDGFKAAAGTVLYFVDEDVVSGLQKQFAAYAQNFPVWAQQANGMLQFSVWAGLRDLGIGANVQHYNPVIDDAVRELGDILPDLLRLAEVEKATQLLAAEIERTRRRVNALEYVKIPQMQQNIKYITMKLDENERANTIRLMKVKDIILKEAIEERRETDKAEGADV